MIFQLTQEDVDRSSTLVPSDIGKWCYVNQGCIEGFFDTFKQAMDSYEAVFNNQR
jgi:hypothetical protein